jgi:hypothetical protein
MYTIQEYQMRAIGRKERIWCEGKKALIPFIYETPSQNSMVSIFIGISDWLNANFSFNSYGSWTLILQFLFHIRLVSLPLLLGANYPRLTLASASSPELSEQPEQALSNLSNLSSAHFTNEV